MEVAKYYNLLNAVGLLTAVTNSDDAREAVVLDTYKGGLSPTEALDF